MKNDWRVKPLLIDSIDTEDEDVVKELSRIERDRSRSKEWYKHHKKQKIDYSKEYQQRPKALQRMKEYYQRPEVIDSRNEYYHQPKIQERTNKYQRDYQYKKKQEMLQQVELDIKQQEERQRIRKLLEGLK